MLTIAIVRKLSEMDTRSLVQVRSASCGGRAHGSASSGIAP
jgi:hypothetical protein